MCVRRRLPSGPDYRSDPKGWNRAQAPTRSIWVRHYRKSEFRSPPARPGGRKELVRQTLALAAGASRR